MKVPPMPVATHVYGAVRDLGTSEVVVARVKLVDVAQDFREFDLTPQDAMDLAIRLLEVARQAGLPGRS